MSSPSTFSAAEGFCGVVSHEAWKALLESLPDAAAHAVLTSLYRDRLLRCEGLEVGRRLEDGRLWVSVQSLDAVLGETVVRTGPLSAPCGAGQSLYLVVSPAYRPLAEADGGILRCELSPQLTAQPTADLLRLELLRVSAWGEVDPWFWPPLACVASHPLSLRAAQAIGELLGDAPWPLRYVLSRPGEVRWCDVLAWLLHEARQLPPDARPAPPDWEHALPSDSRLVHLLVQAWSKLRSGGDRFRRRLRGFELVRELTPQHVEEFSVAASAGSPTEPSLVQRMRFGAPVGSNGAGASASLYLALIVGRRPHTTNSQAHVLVRQYGGHGHARRHEATKVVTPGTEPAIYATLEAGAEVVVEATGGRIEGAALYQTSLLGNEAESGPQS